MVNLEPSVLGLRRSFGFGDRLGLATPGHMDAISGTSFLPMFAQQSIRELTRTQRSPEDVMKAAVTAVQQEQWPGLWGADADHLQTREDVDKMAIAGYTFYTIDPSAYVNNKADGIPQDQLSSTCNKIKYDLTVDDVIDLYFGKSYNLDERIKIKFNNKHSLLHSLIKYGAALQHTKKMSQWISEACFQPYEIEMSVDETLTPTSPLEHLFIGLELKRMGVNIVSIAPRFIGEFEKGIDYIGSLTDFEDHYQQHVAIAKYCGPYKLSIHSGSDKFGIYPIIGKLSGDSLHVKTAGTSYLEAIRVICRTDKNLFGEIINLCRKRFNTDKTSYHVSAKLGDVPKRIDDPELEYWYLDNDSGRQILHVTFGSVLAGGKSSNGALIKDLIIENLIKNDDLYREVLRKHLGKHIRFLLSET